MKCDELIEYKAYEFGTSYVYSILEVNEAIAELKQKLSEKDKEIESLKASHYAEMVDAGMRERRLTRALWLARAERAKAWFCYWCSRFGVESGYTMCDINGYSVNTKRTLRMIRDWIKLWQNVERKCRAKAEQYK